MNYIQQARDVLAKWRENSFSTLWEVDTNTPFSADLVGLFAPAQKEYVVKFDDDRQPEGAVANLIVGTAGNPELLDAIDGLLASAQTIAASTPGMIRFIERADRIAAAIITADERMSATR